MHCVSKTDNTPINSSFPRSHAPRGNAYLCIGKSKFFGVYAYLFLLLFCVRLCTPQGGIELNVSVAKKSS